MAGFEELSFSAENFERESPRLSPAQSRPLPARDAAVAHLRAALSGDARGGPGWRRADRDGGAGAGVGGGLRRPPADSPHGLPGRVTSSHRLEDGTCNVLLLGLCRVRILEELPAEKSFREAKVEVCADHAPPDAAAELAALHRRVCQVFLRIAPLLPEAQEQLDQILGSEVPLGVLTDVISYMLDLGVAEKEALLAECDVQRRAERLLARSFRRRGRRGFSSPRPGRFSLAVQRELAAAAQPSSGVDESAQTVARRRTNPSCCPATLLAMGGKGTLRGFVCSRK